MDDKKTEVLKEGKSIPSSLDSLVHEESSDVSQRNIDNRGDKKNVTTQDTDCGGGDSTIDGSSSAQGKQNATLLRGASIDDEDFSLRLESSDEDTFKDALDSEGSSKKIQVDVKSAISKKSETLFSDIESSDDSIVYEPKGKTEVDLPEAGAKEQSADKEILATDMVAVSQGVEGKVKESEFDLVESDEEFFEDLAEKTGQLSQETISDKTLEEDEEERSSTPLIDEENDEPTITGSVAIESNLEPVGSPSSIMDLMIESSTDISEQIDRDSIDLPSKGNSMTTTEIATSQVLTEDKSKEIDEKETSIGCSLIPDVTDEIIVLPSISLLLEENKKRQADIVTPESSKQVKKQMSDKSEEALSNVDLEPFEAPQKEFPDGVENTSMSPKTLEDEPETMITDVMIPEKENLESLESSNKTHQLTHDSENISTILDDGTKSQSHQTEQMDTDIGITKQLILDGDDKMEEKIAEINESLASENEKRDVEEPMEIDDTIFEVSDVSLMETIIEDESKVEKTNDQCLDQNETPKYLEQQEVEEEEEINLKLDKPLFEVNDVSLIETIIEDDPKEEKTNDQCLDQNETPKYLEQQEVEEEEEINLKLDKPILDVSDVSLMETIIEDPKVKKTNDQCLEQNETPKYLEQQEVEEEEEINLKLDKSSDENQEFPIVVQSVSDTKKLIEQSTTKSSEIDDEQKPTETKSCEDLLKMEKSNKEDISNKSADSNQTVEPSDSIEELQIIETEKLETDDKLVNQSCKLSADVEMNEAESIEIEKPDDGMKKSELVQKPDDVIKSQNKTQEKTEKLSKITSIALDDDTENKEGTPKIVIEGNIDKSPKTSKNCEVEIKNDTKETTEEIQNTDIDGSEKSNEKIADLCEQEESPKKNEKPTEKSVEIIGDPEEKEESQQNLVETSHESPKKLSDESSKEIVSNDEKEESSPATHLETLKGSNEEAKHDLENSIETTDIKKTSKESNKPEKDADKSPEQILDKPFVTQETDSIENQDSLKEIVVSQETDSVEKQICSEKEAVSQEIDSVEKQVSSEESTVSQAGSKISDDIEPIKCTEVLSPLTPEISTEVVVEKVVEVATTTTTKTSIESTKPEQTANSVVDQNAKNAPARIDPEIIEIDDDDDDDIQEQKKSEDSSKEGKEKSTSSTNEKDLQDKKTNDDALKTTQNNNEATPMDIDEEITQKPSQKIPIEEEPIIRDDAKKDKESTVKEGDATMKGIPVQIIDDDDEPLLMIDTSHKEDNDTESICMDNETATSAPTTDSSSEGSLEVFYDKECVNYECKRATKNFYRATVFTMNYFKVSKKRSKTQFVCEDCYDRALSSYEELCKTLKLKQPLLHGTTFKCQEFVEIIDSSDEDESDTGGADKVKVSDENALPKDCIEMLEAELEGAIRKVMHNVDIQKQLSWTKQILQQRLTNIQEDSDYVSEQLRALQRKADHMHNSLYQCPKIKVRQLTPLDLNSGRMYNPESDNSAGIPLPGDIIRNPICVNEQYYAVKTKAIASWVPCKVIEEVEGYPAGYNQTKTYKIKFTTKLAKYPMFKTVYAKHMAYHDPPNVRLPIGSRVIAYFDATSLSRGKEKMLIPSAFYPGIIAEPLKQSNKFRYLVFYDDGYFQYVNHKDVRLVCQASENVWEDVHHQSREFIHNYLTQYAVNRPMVQTQKGQSMLVDHNGKWIYARVIDVDCSLVQMLFEGQSRSEWIYRGSTRLGPVYKESNNLSQKNTLTATRRRTEPFIRYINGDDSTSSQQVQESEQPQTKIGTSEIRSVAKKSVSRVDNSNNNTPSTSSTSAQPVPTVRHLNNSTIFVDDDNKPKGKVVYYTARKNLPPRNYVPHICNPSCPFNITHNLSFYSPLAKPLLSGWERQVFRQKSKKFIIYRGPCGKRMRNIEELHRYLRVTDNELNVDNFDFSPDTNCLAEYVLEKCLVNKKDISCGKEKMPIPCVNYYDETMPPACEYSAVRIPTEGVPLNLDEEFLCGCDCEDDCSDKTKCACWQLTYAGAKYGMPTVPTDMVGYQYKRLYEHVPTGIYECNSRCKCKANCVNRVVQQPLNSKLQVFKTSNRGWGLRCINDVPRGSFICVYAGQMLTEQVANEGGLDAGDEYFAELDYIEVAEQIKEGYESDVQEPEEDEDLYNPDRDDDDMDFRGPGESFKDKEFNTRLRARKGNKNSTDGEFDSQERQVISFEPNKTMDTSNEPNEKPTIRNLFGKDESCYVMDAKVRGNLGRYFNHSCSPNLFVQNVFVDTHDLRFPWVAFFASTHIRAGTELTWNYNYEVGVVPGKVLYCQCGAPNCRQRLL